ncbi:hypothetical protein ACFYNY_24215 [Streptomyces sp. NPDC006530]|uniref:hypothetical protein n=1 Tax=Streptomyces sp. NPDC006530 TaxID=3364750 RepID=UPI0036977BF5
MDDMEVLIRADDKGGIMGLPFRSKKGYASAKQVDAVIEKLKSNPKMRADKLRVTKDVREKYICSVKAVKEGKKPDLAFKEDRTEELTALIEALEKM